MAGVVLPSAPPLDELVIARCIASGQCAGAGACPTLSLALSPCGRCRVKAGGSGGTEGRAPGVHGEGGRP